MTNRFLEVTAPTMTFEKLDSKVVGQICSASEVTRREAIAIKNAALSNRYCPSPELLKSADTLINLVSQTIDQQKCR